MEEILRLIKGEVCMGTYGLVELELRKLVEGQNSTPSAVKQLKAEIRSAVDTFCNCAPVLVPQEIDKLINRLRELSAI